MMSSAIPARLEYQCGHAALVSLPRIKGETSAQRTRRVALEKSAALVRQCDFCAPVVEIAQTVVPQPVAAALDLPLATLVLETVVDGLDGQQVNGTEPVIAPSEQGQQVNGTEPVIAPSEQGQQVNGTEPVIEPSEQGQQVSGTEPVIAPSEPVEPATPRVPSVKLRAARTARPRPRDTAREHRQFLVQYRVERLIQAVDVRDALRQVASFGATDVLEIARQD